MNEIAKVRRQTFELVLVQVCVSQTLETTEAVRQRPQPVAVLEVSPLEFVDDAPQVDRLETLQRTEAVREVADEVASQVEHLEAKTSMFHRQLRKCRVSVRACTQS